MVHRYFKTTCFAICVTALTSPSALMAQAPGAAVASDAQEPLTFDEMLVLDGKSYAKIYGVSLEEAMRRVLVMNDTADDIAALATEFSGRVAGQYFSHGSDFGLKMRLTGKAKPAARQVRAKAALKLERQAARRAERAVARTERKAERMSRLGIADRDLALAESVSEAPVETTVDFVADAPAERDTVFDLISTRFADVQAAIPQTDSVGYDERRGSVVVSVVGAKNSVQAAQVSAVEAIFPVPVVLQFVPKRLSVTAAYGGTPNHLLDGSPWCTNAFVGYNPANSAGLFGASHCQWNTTTNQSLALNYRDSDGALKRLYADPNMNAWTTHGDMLFMTLGAGLSPTSYFYADKGAAARQLTGRRTMATTTVKSGSTAGSMICFYGRTTGPVTGQSCGEVVSKGMVLSLNANEPEMKAGSGTSYYVAVQGPSTTMKCQGGDSGAPWFALSIAWGTMSRCAEYHVNGTDSYAIYTSMDAAYAKNYRLSY